MLQQILQDMYVDPEVLAELSEEQKQLLFCKMREEQIRRWREREDVLTVKEQREQRNRNAKTGSKSVTFKTGADGNPWVWVMGEHPDDIPCDTYLDGDDNSLPAEGLVALPELSSSSISAKHCPTRVKGMIDSGEPPDEVPMQRNDGTEQRQREEGLRRLEEEQRQREEEQRQREEEQRQQQEEQRRQQQEEQQRQQQEEQRRQQQEEQLRQQQEEQRRQQQEEQLRQQQEEQRRRQQQQEQLRQAEQCRLEKAELAERQRLADAEAAEKQLAAAKEQQQRTEQRHSERPIAEQQQKHERLAAERQRQEQPRKVEEDRLLQERELRRQPPSEMQQVGSSAAEVQVRLRWPRQSPSVHLVPRPAAATNYGSELGVARVPCGSALDPGKIVTNRPQQQRQQLIQQQPQQRLQENRTHTFKAALLREESFRDVRARQPEESRLAFLEKKAKFMQPTRAEVNQLESLWREQEVKAKAEDERRRSVARQAREEYKRNSITANTTRSRRALLSEVFRESVVLVRPPTEERPGSSRPTPRPLSTAEAESWFRLEEQPKQTAIDPKSGMPFEWFHGAITRAQAEDILITKKPHSFLVRLSDKIWGYAISCRAGDIIKHYLIDVTEFGYQLFGTNQREHSSLAALVQYHKRHPITSSGQELLMFACGQTCSSLPDYADLFSDLAENTRL